MKSLVTRLTAWFALSFIFVTIVMVAATYMHLHEELHEKNWKKDYPDHPDWKLHGSYSEEEVNDILEELMGVALLYGIPLAIGAGFLGYWVARKSVRPISCVNLQLQDIGAHNLSKRIELPEIDSEFRDLVRNIKALIERLEISFAEMSEYAAKVAHELRTPLAILRLKFEQAGSTVPAELSEEVQAELHQLTHVVDQSLLIAKAEQGRVLIHRSEFDLCAMVSDIAEDFARLANEDGRVVHYKPTSGRNVIADATYARQIIHNFLSNAYKHGKGDIFVELEKEGSTWTLTIRNATRSQPSLETDTLGLGLRVVDSLLRLQPEIVCSRKQDEKEFIVQIKFPKAAPQIQKSGE